MKRVDILLRDPAIDMAVKRWAFETLLEDAADRQQVLRNRAYEDVVLEYVQRAVDEFTDDDAERTMPVCSCADTECPLKQQQLPKAIRTADSIDDGIRTFRQEHRGNPTVLNEAQAEWSDLVTGVESTLRWVMLHLSDETVPNEDAPTPPTVSQTVTRSSSTSPAPTTHST